MVSMQLLLLLLMPVSATAIGWVCGSSGNYTANSTYQSNLAVLATTVPGNASSSAQLFATATTGVVHALALCRRDTVNTTACRDCVDSSFKFAQKMCPYHKTATVYYDYDEVDARQPGCVLGFSDDGGFLNPASSSTRNSTFFQFWNPGNITGNASVVAAAVHELLTKTAQDAAAATVRGFATAFMDSIGRPTTTLYSLAQCTPDLSAGDCLACLQRLVGTVNATNSEKKGGRIFMLRCNVRFEVIMFYNGTNLRQIPFPPPASIAPAPVPAPAPTGRGIKPWVIALSVTAPVALVAFCFIVYCL